MLPDGTYTGVVDRFEEDADGTELAVLPLEEDGEVVEQVDLPRAQLPSEASQDAVLTVVVLDGEVDSVRFDREVTSRKTEEAQNRFDRLADRPPSGPEDPSDSE